VLVKVADALEARVREDTERTREALQAHYLKDSDSMLDKTGRFVRAHPKLDGVLQKHGLGSRPDIVEGLAAPVFSSGWR
jgi:hypothetical protein